MPAADPPVEGQCPPLRFQELTDREFEDLTTRICNVVWGWNNARRWGDSGEKQDGLDTIDDSGRCAQAKRRKQFGPAMLRSAVELWESERPANSTELTITLSRTPTVPMLKELGRLKDEGHPVEVIGADQLDVCLRFQPAVVAEFFSPLWAERFCDPAAVAAYMSEQARQDAFLATRESAGFRTLSRLLATGIRDEDTQSVLQILGQHTKALLPSSFGAGVTLVSGDPGSGKSSFLDALVSYCSETPGARPIVHFDLRDESFDPNDVPEGALVTIDHADSLASADQRLLFGECRALCVERKASIFVAGLNETSLEGAFDRLVVPPLDQTAVAEVLKAGAGRQVWLQEFDESVQDALRQPLYALLASVMLRAGDAAELLSTRSKLGFVHLFCSRLIIDAPAAARSGLIRLATQLITSGSSEWRQTLSSAEIEAMSHTRLVEFDDRHVKFRLPLFENEFAALAILEQPTLLGERILYSGQNYERWRKALATALALASRETVGHFLKLAADTRPSAVFELPTLASGIATSVIEAPAGNEVELIIREALEDVLQAIGAIGSAIRLHPDVVHARLSQELLSVALVVPGFPSAIAQLESGIGFGTPLDPAIRRLENTRFAPTDHLWPWRVSIRLAASELNSQRVLSDVPLPVPTTSALWNERRYAISRRLARQTGGRFDPVDPKAPLRMLVGNDWGRRFDFRDIQSFAELVHDRDRVFLQCRMIELAALHSELSSDQSHPPVRPWTMPDQDGSLWGVDRWSPEAWVSLANEVYLAALNGYEEMVKRWFAPLAGALPLSSAMPVRLEGFLQPAKVTERLGVMTLTSRFVPCDVENEAAITFHRDGDDYPAWSDFRNFDEDGYRSSVALVRNRNLSFLHPKRLSTLTSSGTVRGTRDDDAQKQALLWLAEDLCHIGVPVERRPNEHD